MAMTTGMVGHGFYNRNSAPQWATIARVLPWLEEAIADMGLAEQPAAVGVADFGCSEGRNSLQALQPLVAALRRRSPRPIQTIHSDLPTNDYAWLLRNLRSAGRSVFAEGVYSTVVGGSMYDQLLPPASIHLAMSFNAIGYLSRRPVERLPDYIVPHGPSARGGVGSVSAADREAFATAARRDVEAFLRARAAELVPGGKLMIEAFGIGNGVRTCDGIFDALNDALLEVLDAGMIDRPAYEAYYQPVYFRTLEELVAPVATTLGGPAPLFCVTRAESYEIPVPFVEEFRRTGDVAAYARSFTDFFRAFTEPVIRNSFPGAGSNRLVEEIFARARRLIQGDPDRYEYRYVSVAALLTRQPEGARRDQPPASPA